MVRIQSARRPKISCEACAGEIVDSLRPPRADLSRRRACRYSGHKLSLPTRSCKYMCVSLAGIRDYSTASCCPSIRGHLATPKNTCTRKSTAALEGTKPLEAFILLRRWKARIPLHRDRTPTEEVGHTQSHTLETGRWSPP